METTPSVRVERQEGGYLSAGFLLRLISSRGRIIQPVTHYWRVRSRLPERFGEPCRVLARGRRNTILVEFADGALVLTSRNYVRRLPNPRA